MDWKCCLSLKQVLAIPEPIDYVAIGNKESGAIIPPGGLSLLTWTILDIEVVNAPSLDNYINV